MKRCIEKTGIVLFLIVLVGLTFSSAWDVADTYFSGEGIHCVQGNNLASWVSVIASGPGIITTPLLVVFNSSGNVGDCKLYRDFSSGIGPCCPDGYQCNLASGICSQIVERPCEGLSQEDCTNANQITGDNPAEAYFKYLNDGTYEARCDRASPVYSDPIYGSCSNLSSCLCYWDEDDNQCNTAWIEDTICGNGPLSGGRRCEYSSTTVNQCDTVGTITITYTVRPTNFQLIDTRCTAPPQRVLDCSAVMVVPFFSSMNVIFFIFGIIGIYFFYLKKYRK